MHTKLRPSWKILFIIKRDRSNFQTVLRIRISIICFVGSGSDIFSVEKGQVSKFSPWEKIRIQPITVKYLDVQLHLRAERSKED
jgi:hypothetical protein